MRFPIIHWIVIGIGIGLWGGCCTSGPCLDQQSSKDRDRLYASQYQFGLVVNDSVSSPNRDRTDWKYVDLQRPGKLAVELHWDNGRARLEMAVFDVMGIKIQDGRAWSKGGLRAVVAVEDKGRYYIRIRATGGEDESQYSLRLRFKPDQPAVKASCHGCAPESRKCLGDDSFIICKTLSPGCTSWSKTIACPEGLTCKNGTCGKCTDECKKGKRTCAGPNQFKVCEVGSGGCATWSEPKPCPQGKTCRRGRCTGGTVTKTSPPPPPPPPPPKMKSVRAKIISIYRYRGKMTLHIRIGNNPQVKPGQAGTVLNGDSNSPLPGGQIKISKISGQFAIATTTLQQLGKNRWVRIDLR